MKLRSFEVSHDLPPSDDYIPPELIGLRGPITQERFEEICSHNRKLRLELTSTGEVIIMPPTGYLSGVRNVNLTAQLMAWAKRDGSGVCADSSAGFALPNGATRAPDASWTRREKWERLTKEEQERFGRFCPDFVVEVSSPSDSLTQLRDKMLEYMENGASLGWLIDPFKRRVYVYQAGCEPIVLVDPATVSADPLLPGFTLNVTELW